MTISMVWFLALVDDREFIKLVKLSVDAPPRT